jgi:hypothetical protein
MLSQIVKSNFRHKQNLMLEMETGRKGKIIFFFLLASKRMSKFQHSARISDESEDLSVLQINVWSGSKYDILWSSGSFDSFETPVHHNQRFDAFIQGVRALDPDVISLNEAMGLEGERRSTPLFTLCASVVFNQSYHQSYHPGCKKYLEKLGKALEDYSVFGSIGVGGIILGPVAIPSWRTTEGDALLVKRKYEGKFIGRKRLSGRVYNNSFALNTDDATQVLGISLKKGGTSYAIYCTHWHAGLLDDKETNGDLNGLEGFSDKEINAGREEIYRSTETRLNEARLTLDFVKRTSGNNDVIVLMGDFNSTSGTPELKQVVEGGFTPLNIEGKKDTWSRDNPNVLMQSAPERADARGKVGGILYDKFSKREAQLGENETRGIIWR